MTEKVETCLLGQGRHLDGFGEHGGVGAVLEGVGAHHHEVQHHPTAPDVALPPVVFGLVEVAQHHLHQPSRQPST